MNKVAIFIKSFYRDHAILNCINSIEKYFPIVPYKIYIADDGQISARKELLYSRLVDLGHTVARLPENTGASKSRNFLLSRLDDEKYVLRLDDDFELCAETNILAMIDVLNHHKKIGAVADLERQIGVGKGCFSGDISPWQGSLTVEQDLLIKKMVPLEKFKYEITPAGTKYATCDLTRNMIMFKRAIFKDIHWDNNLIFEGEHEDLMLQIKRSEWLLAFTVNSIHLHRDDLKLEDHNYRPKLKISHADWKDVYYKKWGINKIVLKRPVKYLFKTVFIKIYSMFNYLLLCKLKW